MPIFGKFAASKKTPARKNATAAPNSISGGGGSEQLGDLYDEDRAVPLQLGAHRLLFEKGTWTADDDSANALQKTAQSLRAELQDANEANNLLRLKNTILLNMLTQATADCHAKQKEIEKLEKQLQK